MFPFFHFIKSSMTWLSLIFYFFIDVIELIRTVEIEMNWFYWKSICYYDRQRTLREWCLFIITFIVVYLLAEAKTNKLYKQTSQQTIIF